MDNMLSLLGLAKKAGKLAIGEEPVGSACRERKARLIVLAADAADNTARRADHFAQVGKSILLRLPHTKGELGKMVGRSSCAMAAVTDSGLAAALAERLAREAPEAAAAAGALKEKADRENQRREEKRRHEKKMQRGNRPWAAQPKQQKKNSQS